MSERQVAQDWLALHVFYASDANPLIVEAVRPLVRDLRAEGLIDGWFFIKYWMEGPYIRVRLHPSEPGVAGQVRERAQSAIGEFLARRPALYENDAELLSDLYKDMFLAEYSQEEWDAKYGADGVMPMQANNSVVEFDYEPEFGRYGGRTGMQIAEWHFETSSDTVADLLARSNPHVRPVLLGLGAQLSLILAYAFLETDDAVVRFFTGYRSFWENSYGQKSDDYHVSFDKTVASCGAQIAERIDRIRAAATGDLTQVPAFERRWAAHSRELRDRVWAAAGAGRLTFPGRENTEQLLADREALSAVLLSSYVHMTNNRLGLAILDEIYLSYLVCRTLDAPALAVPA